GRNGELLSSGRLDNLVSCWAAIEALIAAGTGIVALFDHEEVGSETHRGAGSPLLAQVLERLLPDVEVRHRTLARSILLSADMAHATHPNYAERHEPGHWIGLGEGPVVKTNVNQRYATE